MRHFGIHTMVACTSLAICAGCATTPIMADNSEDGWISTCSINCSAGVDLGVTDVKGICTFNERKISAFKSQCPALAGALIGQVWGDIQFDPMESGAPALGMGCGNLGSNLVFRACAAP